MPVKQIVTTLLFYFFFVSVKGQTSRALLVAIDKYPSESGWIFAIFVYLCSQRHTECERESHEFILSCKIW